MNGLCLSIPSTIRIFHRPGDLQPGRSRRRQQASGSGLMAYIAEEMNWPALENIGRDCLRHCKAALKSRCRWFDQPNVPAAPISDSCYKTRYRRIRRIFNRCVAGS